MIRPRFNWIFILSELADILFLDEGVVYFDHTLHDTLHAIKRGHFTLLDPSWTPRRKACS